MNMQHLSNALRESACETLENLAFTELEPEPAARLPETGERLCACIGMGLDGSLDVVLSRALLSEIASILFNLEAGDIDPGTLDDTLLEIANIIAGRYLEKVHQGKTDFTLGLPAVCVDTADWEALPVRLSLVSGPGRLLALGLRAGSGAEG